MRERLPATPAGRFGLGVLGLALGIVLLGAVVEALAPTPSGPRSSSYATSPQGLAGWAELLRKRRFEVRALREQPADDTLPARGTVVVLDPDTLLREEARALRRFAERGGRVVAGGSRSGPWLSELAGDEAVDLSDEGDEVARRLAPAPEVAGVARVETAGAAAFERAGGLLPVLGGDRGPLVLVRRLGRGRVALVADASPLQNARLGRADNAALALALAGPGSGPVTFVEAVHGYGPARGLAALPARFQWGLVLLALAGLLLMAARGRRLGPPEADSRGLPPPRSAYVGALATTLGRTRDPAEASAPVIAAARERLLRRAALPPDAPPDAVLRAALRLGCTEQEASVIAAGRAGLPTDLLAAGTALARLDRETVAR